MTAAIAMDIATQFVILGIHEVLHRTGVLQTYSRGRVVGYCIGFLSVMIAQELHLIPDWVAWGLYLAIFVTYIATGGPGGDGGGGWRRKSRSQEEQELLGAQKARAS